MTTCVRCLVSGRVQGVGYRAAVRREALRLGLDGWAANLPDGRVEVVAGGVPAAVRSLCDWLREGPPLARVTEVRCAEEVSSLPTGFSVR